MMGPGATGSVQQNLSDLISKESGFVGPTADMLPTPINGRMGGGDLRFPEVVGNLGIGGNDPMNQTFCSVVNTSELFTTR